MCVLRVRLFIEINQHTNWNEIGYGRGEDENQ